MNPPVSTDSQIRAGFARILADRDDIGISKILGAWLFEPVNPFDAKRTRKAKPEVLILVIYLCLMGLTFTIFNLK
jgi:hypothetical protein